MKDMLKITVNLVVIYAVGGVLLAWVYAQTSPIIYKNKQEDKAAALKGMMPVHLVANAPEAALERIRAALPEGVEVSVEDAGGGNVLLDALVDTYKKEKKKLKKMLRKSGSLSVSEYSDFDPGQPKGTWEPAHKHAEYFEVRDKDGKEAGYIVESYHKGYSGAPGIYVAIGNDLTVKKVEVLSHNETPGLGDEIEKKWFKDRFKGKTLETLEVVKGDAGDKVEAITGATISTRAITYAARDAVELIRKLQSGELPVEEHARGGEAAGEGESGH